MSSRTLRLRFEGRWLLAGLLIGPVLAAAPADPPVRDFTKIDLSELMSPEVRETRDPETGFVVAGKNDTAVIQRLSKLNGRTIAELEADMRPGGLSRSGFLGPEESLLTILAEDNRLVVDELGLTHQQLARHLHALAAIWMWQQRQQEAATPFLYHGRRYRVTGMSSRGFQESPFADDTKSNSDLTIVNLDNNRQIQFSLLLPLMIERYGFYEGQGTSYRLDPQAVVDVLDFLAPRPLKP